MLSLYPLWWALGVSAFIFPILAVPMAIYLFRNRPMRVPPGFGIWALFLMWTIVSLTMLSVAADNTIAGSISGRSISIITNLSQYGAATIALLYVGNLPRAQVSQRRIVRMFGVLFLATVAGGMLGVVAPEFSFTSPMELLLPSALRADPYILSLVHPTAAQAQAILGDTAGRPAAPFGYTNFWGNNLSLTIVWFVVGWWAHGSPRRRAACCAAIAIAVVPIIYSLNRGLWIGLILSAIYLLWRLVARGNFLPVVVSIFVVASGAVVFVASPLSDMVQARVENPNNSNNIRAYLSNQAIDGAKASPVLGFGGTRKTVGSANSIAVGKTPACPQCGNFAIGSNGQLWALLFSYGFVGTGLFFGFFVYTGWHYRRDRTAIGVGGLLVVGLTILYPLVYISVPVALTLSMISVGLLWRNGQSDEPTERSALVGMRLVGHRTGAAGKGHPGVTRS